MAVTVAVALSTALCVRTLLDRAREAAGLDDLTGLLNRRGLERALDAAFAQAGRTGLQTSVLVLDLDGFKAINDSRGHAAGDRALTAVAHSWSRQLRTGDALARVGGDEFVAVLSGADASVAHAVARRLAASTSKDVSVSIGVATAPADAGRSTLLSLADAAMYREKRDRRSLSQVLLPQPRPADTTPVPSGGSPVPAPSCAGPQPGHDVHFFGPGDGLDQRLAAYIGEGLAAGDVCLSVTTADHRNALHRALGPSAALAWRTGQLIELDAAETLPRLLKDGKPDPVLFDEVIGTMLEGCLSAGRGVRAYGEMVDVLWTRGDVVEALALEDMWNDLRDRLSFQLLCGYAITDPEAQGAGYEQICARHHAVSSSG